MKKFITATLSLVLAGVVAVGLAACNDNTNDNNNGDQNPVVSLITDPNEFDGEELTGFTDIILPVQGETLTIDFDETVVEGEWLVVLYLKSDEGTFDDDDITANISVKIGETVYPLTAMGGMAFATVTITNQTSMTLTCDLAETRDGGIVLATPQIMG